MPGNGLHLLIAMLGGCAPKVAPTPPAPPPQPSSADTEVPDDAVEATPVRKLDGTILDGEWADALPVSPEPAFALHVRRDDDLYLAVEAALPVHVCVSNGSTIRVLDITRSLGVVEYERGDDGWWVRKAAKRDLDRERVWEEQKWTATTKGMGFAGHTEIRITVEAGTRFAVAVADEGEPSAWPPGLDGDECGSASLLSGKPPRRTFFDPTFWAAVPEESATTLTAPPHPPPTPPEITEPLAPASIPAPVVGEHAAVLASAPFFVAADESSAFVRMADTPRDADPDFRVAYVVTTVHGVEGDWVEVTPAPLRVGETYCHRADRALAAYDVRFFVRAGDVVPVVRKGFRHAARGVTWDVGAGEPLSRRKGGGLGFRVPPHGVVGKPVPFADHVVGRSFAVAKRLERPDPEQAVELKALEVPFRFADSSEAEYAGTVAKRGKRVRLALHSGCVSFKAWAPRSALTKLWGGRGIRVPGPGPYKVRRGAKVYWPDGTEAGTVRYSVTYRRVGSKSDDRICFDGRFGAGVLPRSEATLRLCHDRADITGVGSP